MSTYAVNKILYLLENDATFRKGILADPLGVVSGFSLDEAERSALVSGDVRALFDMGAHAFLLNGLSRHALFGVTRDNYAPRIKGEEQVPGQP